MFSFFSRLPSCNFMNSQEMSFKSITFVWACLQTCITKCRKFHGSTVSFPVWLNVKKANFNTMLSDDKRPKNHIIKSTVITFGYNKLQYFAFHVFAKMILGTWDMQIKSISNLNKLTHFFFVAFAYMSFCLYIAISRLFHSSMCSLQR